MKHNLVSLLTLSLMVALVGCSAATPSPTPPPTSVPATPQPVTAPRPAPTRAPGPAVTIYYGGNAQVELISPQKTRVLIDVYASTALSRPATDKDVLLTTHTHGDHIKSDFLDSFPGQQLKTKVGEIKLADVTVRGIASAHNARDAMPPENGTNYIYIVDMAGLRIAHFGDIGQEALTPEQLAALGKVDIAIMQFANSYSAMDVGNKKGFNLMDQVKPRLIIPTHVNADALTYMAEKWKGFYSEQESVSVGRADLSDNTWFIVMGNQAAAIGQRLNLPKINW